MSAACGEADAPGACAEVPDACTKEYLPVCGCDGQTYSNACTARASRASVRSEGACVPEADSGTSGTFCGGFAGVQCTDKNQYCKFDPATKCGSGDQAGVCTARPEVCYDIYKPVCGCDDKTYGNDCEAATAGVSILHDGACAPGPVVDGGSLLACGGLLGLQCPDDQFCSYAPSAICGAADQTGICSRRPEACTFQYAPVCGCDGKTHGNACAAASAGVSVLHDGEC